MTKPAPTEVRIDKWLWAVRLYKTRSLATAALRAGRISVSGQPVKPSRIVKVGEIIKINAGEITRTVKVLALLDKRVGAKLVADFMEDQTPASEYLHQLESVHARNRPKGSGRPTKKERRDMERHGLAAEH